MVNDSTTTEVQSDVENIMIHNNISQRQIKCFKLIRTHGKCFPGGSRMFPDVITAENNH
jgi:hypothetical protein